MIWNSIRDSTADRELDPGLAFEVLLAVLPHEDSDIAVGNLLRWAEDRVVGGYLPYQPYCGRLASVLTERLGTTPAGSSLQLAITRGVVAMTDDATLLRGWLGGDEVPAGLVVDADLRWSLVLRMVRLGAVGMEVIDAELIRDKSSEGVAQAARCRAALPTAEAKEAAWAAITTEAEIGVSQLFAACEGFWHPSQLEITAPYVDRYFAEIGGTAALRSGVAVSLSAQRAFPRFAVEERVVGLAEQLASDEKVAPGIRRVVADMADDLRRAVAVRAAFPA